MSGATAGGEVAPSEREIPRLDDALSLVAVPGADRESARQYAAGAIHRRMLRTRVAGGVCAALLLVGAAVFAGITTSGGDREEVVTPVDDPTTTVSPSSTRSRETTSTVATDVTTRGSAPGAGVPAVPSDPFRSAGNPSDAPGKAPAVLDARGNPIGNPVGTLPSAPTTTSAPPTAHPAAAELEVAPGSVGDLIGFRFRFSDPDGPGVPPLITVRPGGSSIPVPPAPRSGACDAGPGTAATLQGTVQFTRPGVRSVDVTVSYCNGPPFTFSRPVQVGAPTYLDEHGDTVAGRAVLALLPADGVARGAHGWKFQADDGRVLDPEVAGEVVVHRIANPDGGYSYGILVVLPADQAGTLAVRIGQDNTLFRGNVGGSAAADGSATRVEMAPAA